MPEIELTGLDGGNLLAYLAALGTLRVLKAAEPGGDVRMKWVERGFWTPIVVGSSASSPGEFLEVLAGRVCGADTVDKAWLIGDDLTLRCEEFGKEMRERRGRGRAGKQGHGGFPGSLRRRRVRRGLEEGVDVRHRLPHDERSGASAFPRVHEGIGGGHRAMAPSTGAVCAVGLPGRASLAEVGFSGLPSTCSAGGGPSSDPIKTMRGANRLAIEALPLFPTAPQRRRIRTTAFQDGRRQTEVWWLIWSDDWK